MDSQEASGRTNPAAIRAPTLNDLAPEVKLKILSHVPLRDLSSSVIRLNREWRALASDPSLWRSIDAEIPPDDVVCVRRFLARFPGASRIRVRADRDGLAAVLDEISSRVDHNDDDEHLEELALISLTPPGVGNEVLGFPAILEALRERRKLRRLVLVNLSLDEFPRGLEAHLCPASRYLTELRIVGCAFSGGQRQGPLAGVVDGCPELQLLDLRGSLFLSYEDVLRIADSLKRLRALFVEMNYPPHDAIFEYLAENCGKLEALFLHCEPGLSERAALAFFAKPVVKFIELSSGRPHHTLNVAKCLESSSGFGSLLKAVLFDNCGILDETSFKDLPEFTCPNLEWLTADSCRVTDVGVTALIRSCPNLKSLALHSSLGLGGDPWLATVGEHLPKLNLLSLAGCVDLDVNLFDQAARNYPTIVMRVAPPPTGTEYPFLGPPDNLGEVGEGAPITLAALDGRGVPHAYRWAAIVRCEADKIQFS